VNHVRLQVANVQAQAAQDTPIESAALLIDENGYADFIQIAATWNFFGQNIETWHMTQCLQATNDLDQLSLGTAKREAACDKENSPGRHQSEVN
jgi:hypothetical protein